MRVFLMEWFNEIFIQLLRKHFPNIEMADWVRVGTYINKYILVFENSLEIKLNFLIFLERRLSDKIFDIEQLDSLLVPSVIVAHKLFEDRAVFNSDFLKVTGIQHIDQKRLNLWERNFLISSNYNLSFSAEEINLLFS